MPTHMLSIDSMAADGGRRGFTDKNMLFADDLSLPSNKYEDLQTMLNKLRVYAERIFFEVSHCQHTKSEVTCFNLYSENLPPLYYDGVRLPYTDSFKYLGMVCDRQINLNIATDAALRPFTAGTFRVEELFRNITLPTGYMRTYGFSRHTLFLPVCMRVRSGPLLTYNKAKRRTVSYTNGCWHC